MSEHEHGYSPSEKRQQSIVNTDFIKSPEDLLALRSFVDDLRREMAYLSNSATDIPEQEKIKPFHPVGYDVDAQIRAAQDTFEAFKQFNNGKDNEGTNLS